MPTSLVCWFCGGKVIWGGDHTFEDYQWDDRMGDGVIANLHCVDCGATAYFITKPDNDEIPPVP